MAAGRIKEDQDSHSCQLWLERYVVCSLLRFKAGTAAVTTSFVPKSEPTLWYSVFTSSASDSGVFMAWKIKNKTQTWLKKK